MFRKYTESVFVWETDERIEVKHLFDEQYALIFREDGASLNDYIILKAGFKTSEEVINWCKEINLYAIYFEAKKEARICY